MLKTFYLFYFGEVTSPVNVGALFLRLIASSPHFSQDDKVLVKFDSSGSRELTPYTLPKDLQNLFGGIGKDKGDENNTGNKEGDESTPPPREGSNVLVDEPESGDNKVQTLDDFFPGSQTEEATSFREAVMTAFAQISTDQNQTAGHLSYRSLHLTASFLIMFLMRRITKRPEDLISALLRPNIHKHYTDMVPNPFGSIIPNPSNTLNRVLEQALSPSTSAGRELCTIILYLLQNSVVDVADAPVGFLDQKDIGLEAVLKATCMTHIAGAGLPLITLFVTMKTLFNKTERATLEWITYPELVQSVDKIVDLRVTQCKQIEAGHSLKLFPYCRLVHQRYHQDLSYKGNEELCFLMASLIDLRVPPQHGTGGASQASWTGTMNQDLKQQIAAAAKMMYSGSAGFRLTKKYEGQICFNIKSIRDQTWVPPAEPEDQEATLREDNVINIPQFGRLSY